jgi:hypothetical protein
LIWNHWFAGFRREAGDGGRRVGEPHGLALHHPRQARGKQASPAPRRSIAWLIHSLETPTYSSARLFLDRRRSSHQISFGRLRLGRASARVCTRQAVRTGDSTLILLKSISCHFFPRSGLINSSYDPSACILLWPEFSYGLFTLSPWPIMPSHSGVGLTCPN